MKRRKVAIGCAVIVVLVALAVGFLGYGMFGNNFFHATDVPQHEMAPASATSIEVFEARNISGVVSLTYLVGEEEFRKFAAEKSWPLTASSGPIHVRSPVDYLGSGQSPDKEGTYLRYEKRQPNGGGITVTYFPSESRAYIDKSNR